MKGFSQFFSIHKALDLHTSARVREEQLMPHISAENRFCTLLRIENDLFVMKRLLKQGFLLLHRTISVSYLVLL